MILSKLDYACSYLIIKITFTSHSMILGIIRIWSYIYWISWEIKEKIRIALFKKWL